MTPVDVTITNSPHKMITRICDDCGRSEEVRMSSVFQGRKKRNRDCDFCFSCSNKKTNKNMPSGPDHALWIHGTTKNGYKRIRHPVSGERVLEHVLIAERMLGRRLNKDECVHHINMNKTDNREDNLYVFPSRNRHQLCHYSLEQIGYEWLGLNIWFDRCDNTYSAKKIVYEMDPVDTSSLDNCRRYIHKDPRTGNKYMMLYGSDSGVAYSRIPEHTAIAEIMLKRKLYRDECVHHIDGKTLNNAVDNLVVLTNSQHKECHYSLQRAVLSLMDCGIVYFDKSDGLYKTI